MADFDRRLALTPDALEMMDAIARTGSFAAAARELGKVPSALTYSVRQLEQALDVLLFDRRSRNAQLTAAGQELLTEGRRLLVQMDAVANRVRRVATGWETELSIAIDNLVEPAVVFELFEAFYALRVVPPGAEGQMAATAPPTRLRLRTEVLTGTWEALLNGQVDVAIGLMPHSLPMSDVEVRPLGKMEMRLAVAPHHPLAALPEPLDDEIVAQHRIVVMADSAQRMATQTHGVHPGQDVVAVPNLVTKIEAQVRGLGCGRLPASLVDRLQAAGKLVGRRTTGPVREIELLYGWRRSAANGKALAWWLQQLDSPKTRLALLTHRGTGYL